MAIKYELTWDEFYILLTKMQAISTTKSLTTLGILTSAIDGLTSEWNSEGVEINVN